MKTILKSFVHKMAFTKSFLEWVVQLECFLGSRWIYGSHKRLMAIQWGIPPQPKHFDHHIDLFYQWFASRNSLWLERGVFSSLALKGGNVLELACGDGFNTRNFYSLRSNRIVACDSDTKALWTAKRKNRAKNIHYVLADIRTDMPDGIFENIIYDGAIEHFTKSEIKKIITDIKFRLTKDGILSGYTVAKKSAIKSSVHHEYECEDKEDLLRFITPHFKNVTIFETIYQSRHNLYFWASDGILPFRDGWRNAVTENKPLVHSI